MNRVILLALNANQTIFTYRSCSTTVRTCSEADVWYILTLTSMWIPIDPYNLAMRRCFWFLRPLRRPSWSSCRACRFGRSPPVPSISSIQASIFRTSAFSTLFCLDNARWYVRKKWRILYRETFYQAFFFTTLHPGKCFKSNQNLSNLSFTLK